MVSEWTESNVFLTGIEWLNRWSAALTKRLIGEPVRIAPDLLMFLHLYLDCRDRWSLLNHLFPSVVCSSLCVVISAFVFQELQMYDVYPLVCDVFRSRLWVPVLAFVSSVILAVFSHALSLFYCASLWCFMFYCSYLRWEMRLWRSRRFIFLPVRSFSGKPDLRSQQKHRFELWFRILYMV